MESATIVLKTQTTECDPPTLEFAQTTVEFASPTIELAQRLYNVYQ